MISECKNTVYFFFLCDWIWLIALCFWQRLSKTGTFHKACKTSVYWNTCQHCLLLLSYSEKLDTIEFQLSIFLSSKSSPKVFYFSVSLVQQRLQISYWISLDLIFYFTKHNSEFVLLKTASACGDNAEAVVSTWLYFHMQCGNRTKFLENLYNSSILSILLTWAPLFKDSIQFCSLIQFQETTALKERFNIQRFNFIACIL